jgi:hypothetical protein
MVVRPKELSAQMPLPLSKPEENKGEDLLASFSSDPPDSSTPKSKKGVAVRPE